jgi:hypothetical protein
MADVPEARFFVKVYDLEKPAKVAKEVTDSLKGVAGGKMMARMKQEAIFCPVLNRERPFLECFACPNFLRRVRGEVHCAGLALPST